MLDFGAVCDGHTFLQRDLRFGGGAVAILGKYIFDVAFHGEPTVEIVVVPGEVNARILGDLPVPSDGVVFFRKSWRWRAWRSPTYFIPKLSMMREKCMGFHLFRHRPGVVEAWYYPSMLRRVEKSSLESLLDRGKP